MLVWTNIWLRFRTGGWTGDYTLQYNNTTKHGKHPRLQSRVMTKIIDRSSKYIHFFLYLSENIDCCISRKMTRQQVLLPFRPVKQPAPPTMLHDQPLHSHQRASPTKWQEARSVRLQNKSWVCALVLWSRECKPLKNVFIAPLMIKRRSVHFRQMRSFVL